MRERSMLVDRGRDETRCKNRREEEKISKFATTRDVKDKFRFESTQLLMCAQARGDIRERHGPGLNINPG